MISIVRTAVILVLIINFLLLLGGGKEYGRFIKLVTGLLIACSLVAGVLKLTGSLSEENWLFWPDGEQNGMEGLEEAVSFNTTAEKQNTKDRGSIKIEVPLVEEIPQIVMEEILVESEDTPQ